MKRILIYFILVITFAAYSQGKGNNKSFIVSQSIKQLKNGHQLLLKSVAQDSRCPEGTNCVWEGEAVVEISVFENKKEVEEKTVTISSKKVAENNQWFSKQFPSKKISAVQLLPYPKDGVKINPKKYYLKITYSN